MFSWVYVNPYQVVVLRGQGLRGEQLRFVRLADRENSVSYINTHGLFARTGPATLKALKNSPQKISLIIRIDSNLQYAILLTLFPLRVVGMKSRKQICSRP